MGSYRLKSVAIGAAPPGGHSDIQLPPASSTDMHHALVNARNMLDLALRQSRSWDSEAKTLAQYFATTEELRDAASTALLGARKELLCVAQDAWYGNGWLNALYDRLSTLLASGVQVRKLCQPEAWTGWFRSEHHLLEFAERGMEIRISENRLDEMFMIDGRIAFLRVRHGPAEYECLVIRAPAVLESLDKLFKATWSTAHEPANYAQRCRCYLNATTVRILRFLGTGCKDDSAARELGWSVRTYRRHVAKIMRELNASSRFQAGVRAAELGLIGTDDRAYENDTKLPLPAPVIGQPVLPGIPRQRQVADMQVTRVITTSYGGSRPHQTYDEARSS